ncbi:MAG TPA: hypothetical protein IAA40_06570 [Candidatus Olsenella excrementigallinarum]|nr:hypothetical protein [Candidatus Olsenella excrementigallinarum]
METVSTALVTALTTTATGITDALADIAPVALPIIGVGLVVTVGVKFFKRIASKA